MLQSNVSILPVPGACGIRRAPPMATLDDDGAGSRPNPGDRIRRTLIRPAELVPSPNIVERRLAEEIEYSVRVLQTMGERLVGDPTVVARHPDTLQGFDLVAQMLGHIAAVVGAADRREAVERISMADLRSRIGRRSLGEDSMVPPS